MKVDRDVPVLLILSRDVSRVMVPSRIPVQYGKGVESRSDIGEWKDRKDRKVTLVSGKLCVSVYDRIRICWTKLIKLL